MKKLIAFISCFAMVGLLLTGCQSAVRNGMGDITITLEPGVKLEMVDWNDDSFWYLTRPMREGEEAETHIFKQSSNFGVFEGSVTIVETEE